MPESNRVEYTLFFIVRSILFPVLFFLPVFLEDKGITGWRVGLLLGEANIVGIITAFPVGMLNDRREPRALIMVSLLLGGIFLFAFSVVDSFVFMVFLFFVFGLSRHLFQISFDSLFFKQVIKGEGCIHVGRYELVLSLAAIMGMLVTFLVIDSFSFKLYYMGAGFIFILATLLSLKLKISGTKKVKVSEYSNDILKPEFFLLSLLLFLFSLHWGAEDTCYGLFLKHYLDLSKSMSSIYMLSEFITLGAAAYGISRLVDRYNWDLRWIFSVGMLISGITLILKVTPSLPLSMAMRMAHGIGDGMVMVAIYYGTSRIFMIEKMGGNMSLVWVILMSGAFTGSIIFSRIGVQYGYHFSFIISGIILIIVALAFFIYLMKKSVRR